jgi:hypothetical protein
MMISTFSQSNFLGESGMGSSMPEIYLFVRSPLAILRSSRVESNQF